MLSGRPADWRAAPARRGRLSPLDPCCKPDSPGPAPPSAILDSLSHFHFRADVGASLTQALQTCIKRAVRASRGPNALVRFRPSEPAPVWFPLHLPMAWAPRLAWRCLRTGPATRRFGNEGWITFTRSILPADLYKRRSNLVSLRAVERRSAI